MGILESERVSLRPIVRSDLDKLNQWKNEEAVYQYLGGGFQPVSRDIQEKWMDTLMDTTGKSKRFIIQDGRGEAIGMVGLYDIHWVHRTCELGIFLGEVREQGKGYASEAYSLLEAYASRYLNLRKIKAFVVEENGAAVRMYEKLGFVRAGALTAERFINGRYHTVLILEKFIGK